MENRIPGIHHVTAIAGDPQANVDFYVGVLGLRLVKRTLNFDAPDTYHLYYGDGVGSPGTILTFFPWPGAPRGRRGTAQATTTAFAVPANALGYWADRLTQHGIKVAGPSARFGESVLAFEDPDGLALELVARDDAPAVTHWAEGPIPSEHAIRGFQGVTLTEARLEPTDALLTAVLGFEPVAREGNRSRYRSDRDGVGTFVDVVEVPDGRVGHVAVGTVHHVAWRTPDDATQIAWQTELTDQGLGVSPVMDRQYFHSIYFREPGGVLFEIATDPPGFTWDEAITELGTGLKLPPWLESAREQIEGQLPPLRITTHDSP
jgi:glyoxalase family protein